MAVYELSVWTDASPATIQAWDRDHLTVRAAWNDVVGMHEMFPWQEDVRGGEDEEEDTLSMLALALGAQRSQMAGVRVKMGARQSGPVLALLRIQRTQQFVQTITRMLFILHEERVRSLRREAVLRQISAW